MAHRKCVLIEPVLAIIAANVVLRRNFPASGTWAMHGGSSERLRVCATQRRLAPPIPVERPYSSRFGRKQRHPSIEDKPDGDQN
jgi:hypothetical protein